MPPLTKVVRPPRTTNTFDNLVTPSENNLQQKECLLKSEVDTPQSELQEVEMRQLQRVSHTSEQLCGIINQLISKNKVNAKNAFEVPIIEVSSDPLNTPSLSECSWKHFSSTLQNDYKIYGFRVDGYHANAFSMLSLINRQDPAEEEVKIKQEPFVKEKGVSLEGLRLQLEDERLYTLDLASLSTNHQLFNASWRRRALMEHHSIQNILLNNLGLNNRLELALMADSNNSEQQVGCKQIETNFLNLNEYQVANRLFYDISNAFPELPQSQPTNYCELWEGLQGKFCFQPEPIQRLSFLQQEENIVKEQGTEVECSDHIKSSVSHYQSPHSVKKYAEQRSQQNLSALIQNGRPGFPKAKISRKRNRKPVEDEQEVEFDQTQVETRLLLNRQSKTERLNRKKKIKASGDMNISRSDLMKGDMNWNLQTTIQQSPPTFKEEQSEQKFPREMNLVKTKCMAEVTQQVKWLVQDYHLRTFREICQHAAIQESINTAMVFLSVLHLANEVGLSLMQRGEDDFLIQNI